MKLEYMAVLYNHPKPSDWPQRLIRLYDFEGQEHQLLLALLADWLAGGEPALALDDVPFITPLNCQLTLRLATDEQGIKPAASPAAFVWEGTRNGFERAVAVMRHVGDGYAWPDELSTSDIEFLYSPGGTW